MGDQDFETLALQRIAYQANLCRGTVYLHFTDKYDLLTPSILMKNKCIMFRGHHVTCDFLYYLFT
ncbi:TetR family transcriptional regulator [Paenibacillus massiliensis]|uniref:TetR family transcriptional regulator n=1 Tax=Paenibacillus massiliensis TaxID=225917 RepID=UPI000A04A124|nr:TetR family transcriptional regulator [Paenibacillus massiliensis]